MTERIFSFGTLQLESVQQALFGRAVPTTPDLLAGHRVGELRIVDPAVIEASGLEFHPALIVTGEDDDRVPGAVLEVSDAELAAADRYEEMAYRRIPVTLASGTAAWAYLPKEG